MLLLDLGEEWWHKTGKFNRAKPGDAICNLEITLGLKNLTLSE